MKVKATGVGKFKAKIFEADYIKTSGENGEFLEFYNKNGLVERLKTGRWTVAIYEE